jgi:succinate dehydrogenase/fumarate reductase cytochrome b subunit
MQKPLAAGELARLEHRAETQAKRTWVPALARIGLAAKGVSFGIVGGLAVALAAGEGGKATSREGALATLADETGGEILLIALAFGFAAYALWRFSEIFFEDADADSDAKRYARWVGWAGRGLIYAGLTYGTVHILLEGQSQSQNERAHKTAVEILSWPGGTWIVGIVGAAIVGAGLYNGYRGVSRKFRERWQTGEMSRAALKWGTRIGVVGLLARMVVFGLVGAFLIKAAFEFDPSDAIGIDGALQKLAGQSYGPWLLGLTAAGLIAYGIFCLVEARYRRVTPRG